MRDFEPDIEELISPKRDQILTITEIVYRAFDIGYGKTITSDLASTELDSFVDMIIDGDLSLRKAAYQAYNIGKYYAKNQ